MRSVYVDTNVLLYAVGGPHPLREPAQRLLAEVGDQRLRAHTSVEAIQEYVFHLLSRRNTRAVERGRSMASLCVLHPFDEEVLSAALDLVGAGVARGRDAVHAATALRVGIRRIVSADSDFDGIAGLDWVDLSGWTG